jgi:hypothetical protein
MSPGPPAVCRSPRGLGFSFSVPKRAIASRPAGHRRPNLALCDLPHTRTCEDLRLCRAARTERVQRNDSSERIHGHQSQSLMLCSAGHRGQYRRGHLGNRYGLAQCVAFRCHQRRRVHRLSLASGTLLSIGGTHFLIVARSRRLIDNRWSSKSAARSQSHL